MAENPLVSIETLRQSWWWSTVKHLKELGDSLIDNGYLVHPPKRSPLVRPLRILLRLFLHRFKNLCPCRSTGCVSVFLRLSDSSSLQPPSVLHHRHLLQATCYNHFLLLPLLLLTSREENRSRNRLRTPLSWEVRRALGPSTHYII